MGEGVYLPPAVEVELGVYSVPFLQPQSGSIIGRLGGARFTHPLAILPQGDIRLEETENMISLIFKGVFHLC